MIRKLALAGALALASIASAYAQGLPTGGGSGGSGSVTSVSAGCAATTGGSPITTTGTISAVEPTVTTAGTTLTLVAGDCGKMQWLTSASAKTVTLPAASAIGAGGYHDICNAGANTTAINRAGSDTIAGTTTWSLAAGTVTAPSCVRVIADTTSTWQVTFVPGTGSVGTSLLATTAATLAAGNQTVFQGGTTSPGAQFGSGGGSLVGVGAIGGYYNMTALPQLTASQFVLGINSTGGATTLVSYDWAQKNFNGDPVCSNLHSFALPQAVECAYLWLDYGLYSQSGATWYPVIKMSGGTANCGGITVSGSAFGTGPTVVGVSSAACQITVGTTPSTTAGSLTFGTAAATGWACVMQDITSGTVTIRPNTTSRSTTVQGFTFSASPTAGDIITVNCGGI